MGSRDRLRSGRSRKKIKNNSSRKYYKIDDLNKAIVKELQNYSDELTCQVKDIVSNVSKSMVKRTKKDAQYRYGFYRDAISSKTLFESETKLIKVWYVRKPEHRLAHLLDKGHRLKNGKFIKGNLHVSNNEEIAKKELEEEIKEVIKNGF